MNEDDKEGCAAPRLERRIIHVLPSAGSSIGGPIRSTIATMLAIQQVGGCESQLLLTTQEGMTEEWEQGIRERLPEHARLLVFKNWGNHTTNLSVQLLVWLARNTTTIGDVLFLRALLHPMTSAAAFVARMKAVPYVVVPHGTLSHYTFEYKNTLLKRLYLSVIDRCTIQGATFVQCTSQKEADDVKDLAEDDIAIEVIPHPFDADVDASFKSTVREGRTQILFLSRLHPMKGLELLLEAVHLLSREGLTDFSLVIAGSGRPSYVGRIKELVKTLSLDGRVEFLGFVEGKEKREAFKNADVFVLPSKRENYGIAVVEALAHGIPVVISNSVDIWSKVEESGGGFVVERDAKEVATALKRLLGDIDLRRQMSTRALTVAPEHFAPCAVGKDLIGELARRLDSVS